LCPFGSDRTWEMSAVRAEYLAAAVAEVAADPDATSCHRGKYEAARTGIMIHT
jgi:hypothetical protein